MTLPDDITLAIIILTLVIAFIIVAVLRNALGPDFDQDADDAIDRLLDDD